MFCFLDRLSVNVAKRNLDGVMTNSVSIHTAGHRFSFDRFSNSFSQCSPTLQRGSCLNMDIFTQTFKYLGF